LDAHAGGSIVKTVLLQCPAVSRARRAEPMQENGFMQRRWLVFPLLIAGLGVPACSSDTSEEEPYKPDPLPPAEAFQAGVAELKMPVPVGIGTMGFGGIGQEPSITPFADQYPGTTKQQMALNCRAVALSRGPSYRTVLVKCDTVGIFQHLREAVLDAVQARIGEDLDNGLVLAGNHTHSGPGRLVPLGGIYEMLSDTFFSEFYDRLVASLADLVVRAIDDLTPAELGSVMAYSADGHNDRRCENDPLDQIQKRDDLPIVAIKRNGIIDAVVMSYAYHGTILDIGDLTLSGDMGGTVEAKIEERFDHPVAVLFFNAWGGDAAPGDANIDPNATGGAQPDKFDRMEALGDRIADVVMPNVETLTFTNEPEIRSETYRAAISREAIGYPEGVFPYPNGGVYCGFGGDGSCTEISRKEKQDKMCLDFGADQAPPKQTLFTVGRVGAMFFTSATGEWTTFLADQLVNHISEETGGADVMFIGYANDYTGYCTAEQDWWQGGYEAAGGMWGPGQGDYLLKRGKQIFTHYHRRNAPLPFEEPAPVEPFSGYSGVPYVAEQGLSVGEIAVDVPATASKTDVVTFTVLGTDPWFGNPIAVLEKEVNGSFEPVLRKTGEPVDSDGYELWLELTTNPTYADEMPASEREFAWAFHFPVSHRVPAGFEPLDGSYRFAVTIPTDANGGTQVTHTGSFAVVP
jgi:hypothetical protein